VNILIYVLGCLFLIVLFAVVVYNGANTTVSLIFWDLGPAPLGAVIAAAAVFGLTVACAIGVLDGIKIRVANRQLRRQLRRLEEESDALRLRLAEPAEPNYLRKAPLGGPSSPVPPEPGSPE